MINFLGVGEGLKEYFLIFKHHAGQEYQINVPKDVYQLVQNNLSDMNKGEKIPELGRK